MRSISLHDGWRLYAVDGLDHVPKNVREALTNSGIPAQVPGCVHTDLMAAGLLPDPYVGMNEHEQVWVRHVTWQYRLTFQADPSDLDAEHIDLVCEGLDTCATVCVNGEELAQTQDMFLPYRIHAKEALVSHDNTLSITFKPALSFAEQMRDRLGSLPVGGGSDSQRYPFNMIRKMACNFGWDWGPVLTTAGIYRPIYLQTWNTARIRSVRPAVTRADEQVAELSLNVDTSADEPSSENFCVHYELYAPAGNAVSKDSTRVPAGQTANWHVKVNNPQRWWPVGYGEQPLYSLKIVLTDTQGRTLDEKKTRIGLRTTELVTQDEQGKPTFYFRINGRRIYCKGANWIPDDCFPHRVTPERYRQRITQARDANMNMLRVWGGGLYETDDFYDICDELGILVWQDFLTACAAYPEEPPFPELFEQEARHHVARLASHPSLVLWNGGNECIWAAFDWGPDWNALLNQNTRGWGLGYWLDIFPKTISELDPSRPYWANSPYSGSLDVHPNSEEAGNCHHWDVWNGHGEYDNYLLHRPLFASEFGFQGPPTWPTLDRSIPTTDRYWNSPAMILHNKQEAGQYRADRLIRLYFNLPQDADFNDWLFLAQLNQARAIQLGCEWFRSLSPRNSGALYWQLNDCWPVASWSAIDGDGRPKPLWYATRRFFQPRMIAILPHEKPDDGDWRAGPLQVCLHNDDDQTWEGLCAVRKVGFDGRTQREHQQQVRVEPRDTLKFDIPRQMTAEDDALLLADLNGQRATHFFATDKELAYPEPEFDARLDQDDNTIRLTLTAKSLLRDLVVFPERIEPNAQADDQLITLLPGETHTFTITTKQPMSLNQLTRPPVLQCANRFGRH